MSALLKQISPDRNDTLMGLEEIGLSVFPGCETVMEIPMINGKFNIGSNQEMLEKFEKHFGVTFDGPDGQKFLSEYRIVINHDIMSFDYKNPEHEFILYILKVNNGMGLVAMDEIAIENSPINTFKFLLSDENKDLNSRIAKKELKLTAYNRLNEMNDTKGLRMINIAKYLFPESSGIGNNKQVAFDKLEEYISQNHENMEKFLEATRLDQEYVDTVIKVKEAMYRNIIRRGVDGAYVLHATQTKLGRNQDEVIQYCLSPENKDIVGYGMDSDLPYSLSTQLKNINF